MRLIFFIKLFALSLALSLIVFAITPAATLGFLAKAIALGTALSILITFAYPEVRGIKKGDSVSVVASTAFPSLMGRVGHALSNARKEEEVRIRFDNGDEAVGLVEGYEGILSLPKVKLVYEERIG